MESRQEIAATPIRVMLVDDHRTVLWGLSKLIEGAAPTLELVGTVSELKDVLEKVTLTRPDIVLLDLDMNGQSSFQILPELCAQQGVKVIILSGHGDPMLRQQAMMMGALGHIGKEEPAETILTAIERVQAGEVWLDRALINQVFSALTRQEFCEDPEAQWIDSLTAKEREIISSLATSEGTPNKVLAVQLGMADHTLRNHLSTIYGKLGVKNRMELYIYALRNGLADPG